MDNVLSRFTDWDQPCRCAALLFLCAAEGEEEGVGEAGLSELLHQSTARCLLVGYDMIRRHYGLILMRCNSFQKRCCRLYRGSRLRKRGSYQKRCHVILLQQQTLDCGSYNAVMFTEHMVISFVQCMSTASTDNSRVMLLLLSRASQCVGEVSTSDN